MFISNVGAAMYRFWYTCCKCAITTPRYAYFVCRLRWV